MKCPKCQQELAVASRPCGLTVRYRLVCTNTSCMHTGPYRSIKELFEATAALERVRVVIPTIRERAQKWQGEDIIAYQDLIESAAAVEKALEEKDD
jgi:hypothetical protein